MKKLIGITLITSILFSCNGKDDTYPTNHELRAELTQAKHETEILKLQHELDLAKANRVNAIPGVMDATENSNYRYAYLGTPLPADSRRTQPVDNAWTDHETSTTEASKTEKTTPAAETKSAGSPAAGSPTAGSPTAGSPTAGEAKKKKGMSTPVKGALIGAGVGAATGAVVAKNNRVKGAVIGAVVGAGAGAGTGVIIDKRKEKKAESTPYFASNTFLK